MMSKAQHNLGVELALAWERGDEYWATVTIDGDQLLLPCRRAQGRLAASQEETGLTEYLSFFFTDSGDECSRIVRDVSKSILVRIPSGKREATAYAVVNGHVAGEAGEPVPRKRARAATSARGGSKLKISGAQASGANRRGFGARRRRPESAHASGRFQCVQGRGQSGIFGAMRARLAREIDAAAV